MNTDTSGLLSTGDLARLTGNTVRTVRFYEEKDLLVPSSRSPGGHRLYTADQVHLLEWISDLRDAGIPLGTIQRVIHLRLSTTDRHAATLEIKKILDQEVHELRSRLEAIQRVQIELTAGIQLFEVCACCERGTMEDECGRCEVRAQVLPARALQFLW